MNVTKYPPIFVAGPDRSGTTLIYALLASHPNISMVRRTNMWRYFYKQYGDIHQKENFEYCLSDMCRYNRMRHLQPDPERIGREFWQGEPTYGRLFAMFHEHNAERVGKERWGDKSLHTEHYVENVLEEFPDARIIHMTRDPRDRYASVRKRHGKDTQRVGAATGRWLYSMRSAQRNLRKHPDNYMVVRYEDLAYYPEESLRQICSFIHEEYSPEMLTMNGAVEHRDSGGNSSFGRFEPGVISTRSIGRYREILSNLEIAFIQLFAGKYMRAFGYKPEPLHFSRREYLAFYTLVLPIHTVRMFGWMMFTKIKMRLGNHVPNSRLVNSKEAAIGTTEFAIGDQKRG